MLKATAATKLDEMSDEQLFQFVMGRAPIVNHNHVAQNRRKDDERPVAPTFPATRKGDAGEPRKRAGRRGPNTPSKLYRPIVTKRGRYAGQPVEPSGDMPGAYEVVYNALLKATKRGKGVSARDLIGLSGRKPKTVESALYYLRSEGLIESYRNGE